MIFDTDMKKLEETLTYLDDALVAIKHHRIEITQELFFRGLAPEEVRRQKALAMQKEMQDFRKATGKFYNAFRGYYSTPTPRLIED